MTFTQTSIRNPCFSFVSFVVPTLSPKNSSITSLSTTYSSEASVSYTNCKETFTFYMNLLYIKLFSMMVAVQDRLNVELDKKIEAIEVQAKQKKIIE